VNTVDSMFERRLGSALRARQYRSQCQDTILRVIPHTLMIVRIHVSYIAVCTRITSDMPATGRVRYFAPALFLTSSGGLPRRTQKGLALSKSQIYRRYWDVLNRIVSYTRRASYHTYVAHRIIHTSRIVSYTPC
jgi:hypothetical protein